MTEDDYLEFLFNLTVSKNRLLPAAVTRALAGTALLFIGYRVADWNFRVIMRGMVPAGFTNIPVMPEPDSGEEQRKKIMDYLTRALASGIL